MSSNDESGASEPAELTDVRGIGEARADSLREAGIGTVADLRAADEAHIADVLGEGVASRITSNLEETASAAGPETGGGEGAETAPAASDAESADEASEAAAETADGEEQADTEAESTGPSGIGTIEEPDTGTAGTDESDDDRTIAAIASLIIPGAGHFLIDQEDRGIGLLVVWFAWGVVGWGFGLGFGAVLLVIPVLGVILWGLIFLVVSGLQIALHAGAAYDAYAGLDAIDPLEDRVSEFRS